MEKDWRGSPLFTQPRYVKLFQSDDISNGEKADMSQYHVLISDK